LTVDGSQSTVNSQQPALILFTTQFQSNSQINLELCFFR
jgi:hypothetical protein